MESCPVVNSLLELCKCDNTHVCIFCKILIGVVIAVVAGVVGYIIGKRKCNKPDSKEG